jgi:Domain of unknown function (DUF4279)
MGVIRARARLVIRGDGPVGTLTARVGVPPTIAYSRGDVLVSQAGRPAGETRWELETDLPDGRPLADHLTWLLERVDPAALTGLPAGYAVEWIWHVEVSAGEAVVEVDPALVGALPGTLRVEVYPIRAGQSR